MNKSIKWIGIGIAVIIVLLMIVWGSGFRPLHNEILEERPFASVLCSVQLNCHPYTGKYLCETDGVVLGTETYLRKWSGYQGCNNSTVGYGTDGRDSWIVAKTCVCGGGLFA